MIKIIFEAHSTSFDNEAELSSGWNDVELSPLGLRQCQELGERYKNQHLDAVYCSDLQRSYLTGELAFKDRDVPIIRDRRLRECDYGELTQADANLVKAQRAERVETPFPNGESYTQTCTRMQFFIEELATRHTNDQTVMIIGHRATQYGLEHTLKEVPIHEAVTAPWQWQPGWSYKLESAA